MKLKLLATFVMLGSMALSAGTIAAEEPHVRPQEIALSPELLKVLRAEMQEISTGVQRLALALATADWKGIQETSDNIKKSYIMEKKLTPEQSEELAHILPEHFKRLDVEFHQRAAKLGVAASAHDTELVAFHYSRLLESCVQCHAAYAQSRFPGLAPPITKEHHHH